MRRWINIPLLLIFVGVITYGCSTSTVTPAQVPVVNTASDTAGESILALWQVAIEEATGKVTIIPMRSAAWSLNALDILQSTTPPDIEINPNTVVLNPLEHTASVEVRVRHPMPTLAGLFTVFDVRGIVFGPKLTNADGFTAYMNPTDFSFVPFGYVDGRLGTPNWLEGFNSEYSGYKYFADGLGPVDDLPTFLRSATGQAYRGKFPEGDQSRRRYELDWSETFHGYLVFNYAVLADYAWPNPGAAAPFGVDDFSVSTANCAEPFCFEGEIISNTANYWGGEGGGMFSLDAEIWDWQGFDDYEVSLDAPGGEMASPMIITSSVPGSTPYSAVFSFTDIEVEPSGEDDITLVVTAIDKSHTFGDFWFGDLLPQGNWRYDQYVYTVFEVALPVDSEPGCLPLLMDESFDSPAGWITGPGSFWNFDTYTESAADNRSDALCYGEMQGTTTSWCQSPAMTVTAGCFKLPLILEIEHQIDVENFYDRCWVELKLNYGEWQQVEPVSGFKYSIGGWWDGFSEPAASRFKLSSIEDGDVFSIRFVTQTLDGNDNCVQDGFNGWQIFEAVIDDDI